MADPPNGTKPLVIQLIGLVGFSGAVVFALLGMIPGVRSPIDRIENTLATSTAETANNLRRNRAVQREMLDILRAICVRLPAPPSAPSCYLYRQDPDQGDRP